MASWAGRRAMQGAYACSRELASFAMCSAAEALGSRRARPRWPQLFGRTRRAHTVPPPPVLTRGRAAIASLCWRRGACLLLGGGVRTWGEVQRFLTAPLGRGGAALRYCAGSRGLCAWPTGAVAWHCCMQADVASSSVQWHMAQTHREGDKQAWVLQLHGLHCLQGACNSRGCTAIRS